jgi:hypothetical protein
VEKDGSRLPKIKVTFSSSNKTSSLGLRLLPRTIICNERLVLEAPELPIAGPITLLVAGGTNPIGPSPTDF